MLDLLLGSLGKLLKCKLYVCPHSFKALIETRNYNNVS